MPCRSKPGFTLIEILISTAIFAILCTVFFFSFVQRNDEQAVKTATDQLTVDVQRMLSFAQSGRKFNGTIPGAYGLEIRTGNQTSYTMFADSAGGDGRYYNEAEKIQSRSLPKPIVVDSASVDAVAYNKITLSFAVPGGTLTAYGCTAAPCDNASLDTTITSGKSVIIKMKHPQRNNYYCLRVTMVGAGIFNKIDCP